MQRGLGAGAALLLAGCQSPTPRSAPPATESERAQLTAAVRALGPEVSAEEARRAAGIALTVTAAARQEHRPRRPAVWNNVLINLGLRDWGLCWHWTERLGRELRAQDFRTLDVHWACAHPGSVLREHNAVVLLPRTSTDFSSGLILDAWRHSGRLMWVRVRDDRFPWQPDPAAEARWLP